jgi:hypothetical protein
MDGTSVLLLLDEMRKFSDHICDRIDAVGNRLKRIEEFGAKREKQLTSPSAPAPSPSPTSAASHAATASTAAPGEAVFASSGSEHTAAFGSVTVGTPLHHLPARCSTLGLTHGESTLVPVITEPSPPSTSPAAPSALAPLRVHRLRRPQHRHLRLPWLRRLRRATPRPPQLHQRRRAPSRPPRVRRLRELHRVCLSLDVRGELVSVCVSFGDRGELLHLQPLPRLQPPPRPHSLVAAVATCANW